MNLRSPFLLACCATILLGGLASFSVGETPAVDGTITVGRTFTARDTLNCGTEPNADAAACLEGIKWEGGDFVVRVTPSEPGRGDYLLRFPTPHPSGDAVNDLVAMEWYMARDEAGKPKHAPAVVVVHESGRGMVAGLMFARGLQAQGFNTFMIHLPGYGARTSVFTRDIKQMFPGLRQAIADVRRAHDAVAILPNVDSSLIGLQGTSLGGFVVATVAGLDHAYQKSFVLLAGGQLAKVILTGKRDAAKMYQQFASAGVTDQKITDWAATVEPLRLAGRIDASKTWLFSGKFDEVVPPPCSMAWAEAAKLKDTHHLVFPVGHYTAALFMPVMMQQIGNLLLGQEMKIPEGVVPAN